VTASERETAGSVRSANLAYFLPPDWSRVARLAVPALERSTRESSTTSVLIIVPDAAAAVALARAVSPLANGLRVVVASSLGRGKRLLGAGAAHVVIGAPNTLAPLLSASALKLDAVKSVIFASADAMHADDEDLSTIMAEVPKGASRLLTALEATDSVEALLERYLHKARRVVEDVAPAEPIEGAPVLRFVTVAGSPVDGLAAVLDEVDAPSSTIIAADRATADAARALLAALGYTEGGLVRVSDGDVESNSALVVSLGVPTATTWGKIAAAQPATMVAIVAPRDREALQLLAAPTPIQPFAAKASVMRARAAEAKMRAELRTMLADGIPSREVLALEPLLGEFDGLEIAAAALRLLEKSRTGRAEAIAEAEARVHAVMKEAAKEAAKAAAGEEAPARPAFGARERSDRGERPSFGSRERGGDRGSDRSERPRGFAPRGDRPKTFGARSDRPSGPRGDKPFSPRGDKPFAPRGDKPFGARGDKPFSPRGDKPFGARGDKPRGPRRDDGPRGPRGPR